MHDDDLIFPGEGTPAEARSLPPGFLRSPHHCGRTMPLVVLLADAAEMEPEASFKRELLQEAAEYVRRLEIALARRDRALQQEREQHSRLLDRLAGSVGDTTEHEARLNVLHDRLTEVEALLADLVEEPPALSDGEEAGFSPRPHGDRATRLHLG